MEISPYLLHEIDLNLLRFGIPIGITILVIRIFRRMDTRWKAEVQKKLQIPPPYHLLDCWLILECPDFWRESCPAYQNQSIPCWLHFQTKDLTLANECLNCHVFQQAQNQAAEIEM